MATSNYYLLLLLMLAMMTTLNTASSTDRRQLKDANDDQDDDDQFDVDFYDIIDDVTGPHSVIVSTPGGENDEDEVDETSSQSMKPNRNRRRHQHRRRGGRHQNRGVGKIRFQEAQHDINNDEQLLEEWKGPNRGNKTLEERVERICRRQNKAPASSALQTAGNETDSSEMMTVPWRIARRLSRRHLNSELRQTLLTIWTRKRQQLSECCSKTELDDKVNCVKQKQAERFERVCNGEEPICPWSLLKPAHHQSPTTEQPSITTTCCSLQGEERVACFQEGISEYKQRWHHRRATTPSDESDDDTGNIGGKRGNGRRRRPSGRRPHHSKRQ